MERPDGTEVRYIIDYYHDDAAAKENRVPRLQDVDSVKSISIDVRCVPVCDLSIASFGRGWVDGLTLYPIF